MSGPLIARPRKSNGKRNDRCVPDGSCFVGLIFLSGIAGIIRFDGQSAEPGQVEKMTAAMSHRGPDGLSHWVSGSAALGQCMLRTTPESLEEEQPLISEDGNLVLVMDGRVDNWIELRRELLAKGVRLRDHSDTELVLRSYETWGASCLAHAEGDFALAIWDGRKEELFCARDPMGNKPFYYYWDGRAVVFASELQAILTLPSVPQRLNEGMLAEFLASEFYSRDETLWIGIQRLVAAHEMTVDLRGPRIRQYWTPDLFETLTYTRDEEYIEHYRELFTDTVRRLSRSQYPIASEVSGGLDSSAIFVVAQGLLDKQKLLAPNVSGYTLDFHGDPAAGEREYSRAVGKMAGKPIIEVPPAMPPLAWYRDWADKYRDFPGYPNGVMALNLMRQARDNGSRVLTNGIGGDEWLGASPIYYAEEIAAKHWRKIANCLGSDIQQVGLGMTFWWLIRYGVLPFFPQQAKELLRSIRKSRSEEIEIQQWLHPRLRNALSERRERYSRETKELMRWRGQSGEISCLRNAESIMAHETHERLVASCGLELRRPYCTRKMVQFSIMIPKRMLFSRGVNRFSHRQAMHGLLPEAVIERMTKAEFSVTYSPYWQELREFFVDHIPNQRADWVDGEQVEMLYHKLSKMGYDGGYQSALWTLFDCDLLFPSE
jgi:asparagine synthase (glutamine-hydrolysing)